MLNDWEKDQPGRSENIFRSIANIAPSQLADNDLFDFKSLQQKQQKSHLGERLPLFNIDVDDDTVIDQARASSEDAVQDYQP
jgi:tRNA 2-thiocytidine biosynthesis protein TtcA